MNALALVDDCHDPRVIPSEGITIAESKGFQRHRLPNHISRMVLSIVHDGGLVLLSGALEEVRAGSLALQHPPFRLLKGSSTGQCWRCRGRRT